MLNLSLVGLLVASAAASATAAGLTSSAPSYEERLVAWGLARIGAVPEPEPDGRRIEAIHIERMDIFAEGDPFPPLLNVFHQTTRAEVVRRELLFSEGEALDRVSLEESERNLRKLPALAIARIVPVKGRAGGVGVLVVTKDRWSLRLNSEFNVAGSLLQYLRLRPTEQNFLGLNQQVLLDAVLRLDTLALGQQAQDRRFLGLPLSAGEAASLIFNRETGALEGSAGEVVVSRPLYSLSSTWGFTGRGAWRVDRRRVFRGPKVWELPYTAEDGASALVPYVYDGQGYAGELTYTRSWGQAVKLNLTGGVGAFDRRFAPAADSALTDAQRAWFSEGYLPRTERAAFVEAQVRVYTPRYRVFRDLETYALSEDVLLGPSALVVTRWAPLQVATSAQFLEAGLSLRLREAVGEGLVSATLAAAARYVGALDQVVNQRLALEVLAFSPPLEGGRLVARGLLNLRRRDLDNGRSLLGGGNGLRGAPAEVLQGAQLALANVEYRTRAFELKTLFLGLVLFYDVGAAYDDRPEFTHTVGLGLRLLIPQFNQETIRLDLGFVLGRGGPVRAEQLSASFGQVTDYRPTFLDEPLRLTPTL